LALFLDQTSGFVQVFRPGQRVLVGFDVLAQVDRDDVGALGGEHSCVRAPLPARGSTDYRDLACPPAHSRSLLMRSTMRPTLGLKPFDMGTVICSRRCGLGEGADPAVDQDRTSVRLHCFSSTRCVIAGQADGKSIVSILPKIEKTPKRVDR